MAAIILTATVFKQNKHHNVPPHTTVSSVIATAKAHVHSIRLD